MADIYDISSNNQERFSLGVTGSKTLFCFGVNPSTATPDAYDNAMKRLKRIAYANKYDSWLMLNLYPQRATDSKNLNTVLNAAIHKENLRCIEKYIQDDSDILCSWGNSIGRRAYLRCCLIDIYEILRQKKNLRWYFINALTKDGNPRHISRQNIPIGLNQFTGIEKYIGAMYHLRGRAYQAKGDTKKADADFAAAKKLGY
ncbi:MAG: hypothetical protein Pg6C_11170 [Treponemataceae bacterium]|nr:MAG: hypothetical protein Pg6C_11170 [Treponemataceae bacterium]